MKKVLLLFVVTLILILTLMSCGKNEVLNDCVLSSERVVWGNRIYSIGSVPEKGIFLTYTEVGDENETVYVACPDPLCSHEREECVAFSGSNRSLVALVPKERGCVIYFFRTESGMVDPNDPTKGWETHSDLMALDMQNGKIHVVTTIPDYPTMIDKYLLTDSHVYFSLNSQILLIESDVQTCNIWRAPLTGGELEQCTFGEDAFIDACLIEHYEDGIFYYRRGETLCRTVDDFTTEEVVMEGLINLWRIRIHDGWVYYTDERKVISLTADEPKPDGKSVYYYAIGEWPDALDAANICTLMRTKLDGSGTTEELISGISTRADWCIVEDTLYCVPTQYELQGKIEWKNNVTKNGLTYIWSESCGELWAVDLRSKEKRVVLSDLGYDIETIEYTGKGKFLVSGYVYEIDTINKYYETNGITSTSLKFKVWELLDIK